MLLLSFIFYTLRSFQRKTFNRANEKFILTRNVFYLLIISKTMICVSVYGDNHAQRCQRVFAWKQHIYDDSGCEIGQNCIPIHSLRDPITRVTINK